MIKDYNAFLCCLLSLMMTMVMMVVNSIKSNLIQCLFSFESIKETFFVAVAQECIVHPENQTHIATVTTNNDQIPKINQ